MKVTGVSGAGMVMLCGILQMVQLMLAGSKVSEMFWCVLVLLLLLDARNVLLMLVSASKLPMCVMQVVLLLPVSRLCSVVVETDLRVFLVW